MKSKKKDDVLFDLPYLVLSIPHTTAGDFARVFAFASPANKAKTGPLERFTQMIVYNAGFNVMIGHDRFEVLRTLQPVADNFLAVVKVYYKNKEGQEGTMGYLFTLRLQHDGDLEGCWMTDGCQPLGDLKNV